uniref:NADH dehydrogenase subunit 3 n=1 Tax=Lingula reevii TaxID=2792136 RepID=UPI002E789E60|nr:NADH dehydrogenase subunit 3 [Lingula reevii]WQG15355.1 NADH dehydrogenase subunit 3 [Lingula reevii]
MWFSGFYISLMFYTAVASILSTENNWTGEVKNENQSSPYECGFKPLTPQRVPFSLRFFLVSILFVIFDVEVVLVSSLVIISHMGIWWHFHYSLFFFLTFLFYSLVYEIVKGALDWAPVSFTVDGWWAGSIQKKAV